jgi:hypothetical protein
MPAEAGVSSSLSDDAILSWLDSGSNADVTVGIDSAGTVSSDNSDWVAGSSPSGPQALTGSSDFGLWYYSNQDRVLAAWMNAFSEVDLSDPTVDQTSALSRLWNDTLRNLYGAQLPWESQTDIENDGVVSEEVTQVDETVVEDLGNWFTETVNQNYTRLQQVVYILNPTPADGSYGGVAGELIETSAAVYDDFGQLISAPLLLDRHNGSQYLLPSSLTLRSDGDLTPMLKYYGITGYSIDKQGQWVLPVNPSEGIGFLNRALSLTYYAKIQSWASGDEALNELSFPTNYKVEVILPAANASTGTDLTLSFPNTRIGIYFETQTVIVAPDGTETIVSPDLGRDQTRVDVPAQTDDTAISKNIDTGLTDTVDPNLTFSSDFERWYYLNRDAILAEWSNVFSSVDLKDPTVDLLRLWNDTLRRLYGRPLPYLNESSVSSDHNSSENGVHHDNSSLHHAENGVEVAHGTEDQHAPNQMEMGGKHLTFSEVRDVSGSSKTVDSLVEFASPLDAGLTGDLADPVDPRADNRAGSTYLREADESIDPTFRSVASVTSGASSVASDGIAFLAVMNDDRWANSSPDRLMTSGLGSLSERLQKLSSPLSGSARSPRLLPIPSDRVDQNGLFTTSMTTRLPQGSSISGMLNQEKAGINGSSSTTLTTVRRQEFNQEANSQAASSSSARYEKIFRLLHRYWKALKARYSGSRMQNSVQPADEVITREMELQNGLSAQIARQWVRYFVLSRGPPTDDPPPDPEWIVLCDGSDQLNRLRHIIAPRGPSPDAAELQVQEFFSLWGFISAESCC